MVEATPAKLPSAHGRDAQHQESSVTSVTSYIDASPVPAWTAGQVEGHLRKAIAVKAALVGERLGDALAVDRHSEGIGGIRSTSAEEGQDRIVTMAAEAMSWLRWLGPEDAAIVIARLEGAPWKLICWRFDISRPTADRRWRYALGLIAWRLNGNATTDRMPSLRSILGLSRAALLSV
jgi:hypothetical protein